MTATQRTIALWLWAIAGAVISGAAQGVSSALGGPMFMPEVFNPAASTDDMVKFALFQGVIGGVGALMGILKRSPLPPLAETTVTVSQPEGAPPPQVTVTTTEPMGGPGPGGPTPG
jgi:hypothetical protein